MMPRSWKPGIHEISNLMLVCSDFQTDLPNQQGFFVLWLDQTVPEVKADKQPGQVWNKDDGIMLA